MCQCREMEGGFLTHAPNVHYHNATEHGIYTFKDHSLAILVGIYKYFRKYPWNLLLKQDKLTLNLLHQPTLDTCVSTWA